MCKWQYHDGISKDVLLGLSMIVELTARESGFLMGTDEVGRVGKPCEPHFRTSLVDQEITGE